jgi:putative transposase
MQPQYERLSHCKWECKYHVVFIPKYRKKVLYGHIRKRVGQILKQLISQEEGVELVEGHAMGDHVHMCLSIPPKYAVASVVGFLKGKSAVWIFREFEGKRRNFGGMLGAWVLREYRGSRRSDREELHTEPRRGRQAVGSTPATVGDHKRVGAPFQGALPVIPPALRVVADLIKHEEPRREEQAHGMERTYSR